MARGEDSQFGGSNVHDASAARVVASSRDGSGIVDLGRALDRWYPDAVHLIDISRIRESAPAQVERTDRHLVVIPDSGRGHHWVDFHTVPVAPGSVVHVQPGQVHRWDQSWGFDGAVLVARDEVVAPTGMVAISAPASAVIDLADRAPAANWVLDQLGDELARESHGTDHNSQRIITHLTQLLFTYLAVCRGQDQDGEPAGLVHQFRVAVDERFRQSRNVADYAQRLGVSPRHLGRITERQLGITPKELIDQRVALEARRLLVHSTDNVTAIARSLGFSETTNFNKFFVRLTGLRPLEFRERSNESIDDAPPR